MNNTPLPPLAHTVRGTTTKTYMESAGTRIENTPEGREAVKISMQDPEFGLLADNRKRFLSIFGPPSLQVTIREKYDLWKIEVKPGTVLNFLSNRNGTSIELEGNPKAGTDFILKKLIPEILKRDPDGKLTASRTLTKP